MRNIIEADTNRMNLYDADKMPQKSKTFRQNYPQSIVTRKVFYRFYGSLVDLFPFKIFISNAISIVFSEAVFNYFVSS